MCSFLKRPQKQKREKKILWEQRQKGETELRFHINCAGGSNLFILRTRKKYLKAVG